MIHIVRYLIAIACISCTVVYIGGDVGVGQRELTYAMGMAVGFLINDCIRLLIRVW